MIDYNPQFLDRIPNIDSEQHKKLIELNTKFSLTDFLNVPRNIEELGIDFIHATSKIEGNTYDKVETITLLKQGITSGGKKHTDAVMIFNLKKAYDNMLLGNYEINYQYMCDVHYQITEALLDENQRGVVRNHSVSIGGSDYTPLTNENHLMQEMKFLIKNSETIDNAFIRAIYLHLNIAYLQFFSDGNKRTARMIQNAVLLKDNKMPLLFDDKYLNDYVDSLIDYYETGNSDKYVSWFVLNYIKMYEKLIPNQPAIPKRIIADDTDV